MCILEPLLGRQKCEFICKSTVSYVIVVKIEVFNVKLNGHVNHFMLLFCDVCLASTSFVFKDALK